jgi:acyl-CoA thioesterase-2
MLQLMNELMDLLELETIEDNIFRGYSQDVGSNMLYSGQVLGQAIAAAQKTIVGGRRIHSAHAYFLQKGDHNSPVTYAVTNTMEGGSYSSRTVAASQDNKIIFTMMCSFESDEESSLSFAQEIDIPKMDPNTIIEIDLEEESIEEKRNRSKILNKQPFFIRFPKEDINQLSHLEKFWLKANSKLPDNDELHRSILAYSSDFRLLASALRPIGYRYKLRNIMMATICHAIWFHREFKMDEWLYTQCEPLSISNGKGIAKGCIYNENGILVATTMQEGVIRELK